MRELYTHPMSPCAQKVRIAMADLKRRGQNASDRFRAVMDNRG